MRKMRAFPHCGSFTMNMPKVANRAVCVKNVAFRPSAERFPAIAGLAGAIWLDSGTNPGKRGHFDILCCEPQWSILAHSSSVEPWTLQRTGPAPTGTLLEAMSPDLRLCQPEGSPRLPFLGGTMGFIGYDMNRSLEDLPEPANHPTPFPSGWLAYYPWALLQNTESEEAWLVGIDDQALSTGEKWLASMDGPKPDATGFTLLSPWQPNMTQGEYEQAFDQIQQYIHAGDCYQVNFAQRFSAPYQGDPLQAYIRLRAALPSPFSAYINTGNGCLLSHSPERFLQIKEHQVVTSPIKGTRPRGKSREEDQQLAASLLNSSKDRAENLMIVDLLRNDLGRSCVPGSINVDKLFHLESYANVHHLVSTISGKLTPDTSAATAFEKAFPGGSITGAPKVRAMEIINELEPDARSAYCGSVFYNSCSGDFDSSIAIRSLIADGKQIHCWGGGGIVADSTAADEYAESINKVRLLMHTLMLAQAD